MSSDPTAEGGLPPTVHLPEQDDAVLEIEREAAPEEPQELRPMVSLVWALGLTLLGGILWAGITWATGRSKRFSASWRRASRFASRIAE